MSFLRGIFSFIRFLLLAAVVFGIVIGAWCYTRALPSPGYATIGPHEALASPPKRHVEHVILHGSDGGDIGLAINFPDPQPNMKMPIVMVLGGLDTGENNIRNIANPGNNIIVGYDWPMPIHPPSGLDFLLQIPTFYTGAMSAPTQIAEAIDWMAAQSWADDSRISILGYSLGALAAPAAQEQTQRAGRLVRWTILAYGGAPFSKIFAADEHITPDLMRMALTPMVDIVLHPLEPDQHLPNLTGHFLILEGQNDQIIPAEARANMRPEYLEPKTVIAFDSEHMGVGPDKNALMQKIIDTSRNWLTRMGAVNPL